MCIQSIDLYELKNSSVDLQNGENEHKVVQTLKVIGEVLSLVLLQCYYVVIAIYNSIKPPEKQSVSGKIVLVRLR